MQTPVLKGAVLAGSFLVHHLAGQHASVVLVAISQPTGAAKPSSFHHTLLEQLGASHFPALQFACLRVSCGPRVFKCHTHVGQQ